MRGTAHPALPLARSFQDWNCRYTCCSSTTEMRPQVVFVHGIASVSSSLPYDDLAEALRRRCPGCEFHFTDWRELAFTGGRRFLDTDTPFSPPFEEVLRSVHTPLLSERACIWLDIFDRDVGPSHPLWSPATAAFKAELRLLRWVLDYAADIEVYLRDDDRRQSIQDYVRTVLNEASLGGPVIVVAHSLGTVICHEVIHQAPPDQTCLFLTLGSPLQFTLFELKDTGLVTFSLNQHPSLDWVNVYDIKDIVASPLVQDDFSAERRTDWYVRTRFGLVEVGLQNFEGTEVIEYTDLWQRRDDRTGLRVNVALNRYPSSLLAHQGYWHVSNRYRTVIELLATYVEQRLRAQ